MQVYMFLNIFSCFTDIAIVNTQLFQANYSKAGLIFFKKIHGE